MTAEEYAAREAIAAALGATVRTVKYAAEHQNPELARRLLEKITPDHRALHGCFEEVGGRTARRA
jgi:hypothetical protein